METELIKYENANVVETKEKDWLLRATLILVCPAFAIVLYVIIFLF